METKTDTAGTGMLLDRENFQLQNATITYNDLFLVINSQKRLSELEYFKRKHHRNIEGKEKKLQ